MEPTCKDIVNELVRYKYDEEDPSSETNANARRKIVSMCVLPRFKSFLLTYLYDYEILIKRYDKTEIQSLEYVLRTYLGSVPEECAALMLAVLTLLDTASKDDIMVMPKANVALKFLKTRNYEVFVRVLHGALLGSIYPDFIEDFNHPIWQAIHVMALKGSPERSWEFAAALGGQAADYLAPMIAFGAFDEPTLRGIAAAATAEQLHAALATFARRNDFQLMIQRLIDLLGVLGEERIREALEFRQEDVKHVLHVANDEDNIVPLIGLIQQTKANIAKDLYESYFMEALEFPESAGAGGGGAGGGAASAGGRGKSVKRRSMRPRSTSRKRKSGSQASRRPRKRSAKRRV